MMEEAESEGALDQEYLDLDRRAGFACDPLVSTGMSSADRKRELESLTGSEEDWGPGSLLRGQSGPERKLEESPDREHGRRHRDFPVDYKRS